MNYPYQSFFLDIQLAKRRLEKALRPACGVADGTLDGHRLAEPCPAGPRLTDAGTTQELAKPVFCGVAIEGMRRTANRPIVGKANSSGEAGRMSLLRNCKC